MLHLPILDLTNAKHWCEDCVMVSSLFYIWPCFGWSKLQFITTNEIGFGIRLPQRVGVMGIVMVFGGWNVAFGIWVALLKSGCGNLSVVGKRWGKWQPVADYLFILIIYPFRYILLCTKSQAVKKGSMKVDNAYCSNDNF